MTEIDKKGNVQPNTKRAILASFVATFSGGLSPNTVRHSGTAALAVASARMDVRAIHHGLREGGNSTTTLEGGFQDFVPVDGKLENDLQEFPGTIMHITELEDPGLLSEAPRPAVIGSNTPELQGEKPARAFHISVFSAEEEPPVQINHWFGNGANLKRTA